MFKGLILGALLLSMPLRGAISFVSSNAQSFAIAASYALTFTTSAGSGNLLILGASMGGTSNIASATWAGSSFTRLTFVAGDNLTVFGTEVWYLANPASSTTSNVTVTVSGANVASSIEVMEYSGQSTSSPLSNYTYGATGSSGTTLSTTLTTATSDSYVICILSTLASTPSSGSGFTTRATSNSVLLGIGADKSSPTPGQVGSYWSGTGGYAAQYLLELIPFVSEATTPLSPYLKNSNRLNLNPPKLFNFLWLLKPTQLQAMETNTVLTGRQNQLEFLGARQRNARPTATPRTTPTRSPTPVRGTPTVSPTASPTATPTIVVAQTATPTSRVR